MLRSSYRNTGLGEYDFSGETFDGAAPDARLATMSFQFALDSGDPMHSDAFRFAGCTVMNHRYLQNNSLRFYLHVVGCAHYNNCTMIAMEHPQVEPTNRELFELIQRGFTYIEERFARLEERVEQGFALLNERMHNLEVRVSVLERDMVLVKVTLFDIQEELSGHGRAIDKDAVMLIGHEKRIRRLENKARFT